MELLVHREWGKFQNLHIRKHTKVKKQKNATFF